MNHTPNYNLNQWSRDDRVLMEDFNADNQKIEAAILAARKAPSCVTGTYVGNGGTVTVNVGFRPSFLVVMSCNRNSTTSANVFGILGGSDQMLGVTFNAANRFYPKCQIIDTGFKIDDPTETGMNANGITFCYYAFY